MQIVYCTPRTEKTLAEGADRKSFEAQLWQGTGSELADGNRSAGVRMDIGNYVVILNADERQRLATVLCGERVRA